MHEHRSFLVVLQGIDTSVAKMNSNTGDIQ